MLTFSTLGAYDGSMTNATTTTATLPAGTTFANGVDGLHAHTNWGEMLTIVKRDPQAYGSVRYVVADTSGRRMFAFPAIAY